MAKDKATSGAADKVASWFDNYERKRVDLAEMDLTIYLPPVSTGDLRGLMKRVEAGDLEAMIDFIIRVAKDESGDPVFAGSDKPVLVRKFPVWAVTQIVETALSEVGQEKN